MADNLYGYVNYTNALDLSKLDNEQNISNKDLKDIIFQLHSILEQTTMALNILKNPKESNAAGEEYVLSLRNGSLAWRPLVGGTQIGVGLYNEKLIISYIP